jgi:hypothetical protein
MTTRAAPAVEPVLRRLPQCGCRADSTWCATDHLTNERRVGSSAKGGIEIHDGHLAGEAEFLEAGERIAAVEYELAAAPKLHGAAVHEVDTGNDHGRTS